MTLLSIREQEAVQEARDRYEGLVEDRQRERERAERICRDGKWDHPTTLAEIEAAWADLRKTVILATRDAIARQVREEADRLENAPGAHPIRAAIHRDAATFIEGLDV